MSPLLQITTLNAPVLAEMNVVDTKTALSHLGSAGRGDSILQEYEYDN